MCVCLFYVCVVVVVDVVVVVCECVVCGIFYVHVCVLWCVFCSRVGFVCFLPFLLVCVCLYLNVFPFFFFRDCVCLAYLQTSGVYVCVFRCVFCSRVCFVCFLSFLLVCVCVCILNVFPFFFFRDCACLCVSLDDVQMRWCLCVRV